jgi:hypothetical protein
VVRAPADTLAAVDQPPGDRDLVMAFMWFTLAEVQETEAAQANKERIEEWLTPDLIAEAERLAQEWIDTHPQAAAAGAAPETIRAIR